MLTRVKNYQSEQLGECGGGRIGSEATDLSQLRYQLLFLVQNSQPEDSIKLEET